MNFGLLKLPKGFSNSPCRRTEAEVLHLFTVPTVIPTETDNTDFISSANPNRQRTCHFHRNPFQISVPFYYLYIFHKGFGISHTNLIIFILQERGEVALLLWWGTEGGAVCVSCIGLATWLLIQTSRARAGHGAVV